MRRLVRRNQGTHAHAMIDTSTYLGGLLCVVAVLLAATLFVWAYASPKRRYRRWRARMQKDYWSKGKTP